MNKRNVDNIFVKSEIIFVINLIPQNTTCNSLKIKLLKIL